jgi:cell division protein ZapA
MPMAQVTVTIDGKNYRMACEEGQEEHLMTLAGRFDRYIAHLKESFGAIGDQRLTVMAGIMIMDEMAELQKRASAMEAEIARLNRTSERSQSEADGAGRELAGALGGLAARMEALAARLEGRDRSPGEALA